MTEKNPDDEVTEIIVPLSELVVADVSDKAVERQARGFIMGSQAIGRRKEIKETLEKAVVKKIGAKGKYLTDKLFELIEGVYVIDKKGGKDGREIRYYQVPPNLNAIIYALDRVLGKPKIQVEKTEVKKGIIVLESVIKNLASHPYRNDKRRQEQIGSGEDVKPIAGEAVVVQQEGSVAGDGSPHTARVDV